MSLEIYRVKFIYKKALERSIRPIELNGEDIFM